MKKILLFSPVAVIDKPVKSQLMGVAANAIGAASV